MHSYKWKFIEDLPIDWQRHASQELQTLSPLWNERKEKLKNKDADLIVFNQKLQREWAIETGIIENLYTLDRGTTQLLIEHGFEDGLIEQSATNRPSSHVISVLRDHSAALDLIYQFIKDERSLSTAFVKSLHDLLTRNQTTVEAIDSSNTLRKIPFLRGDWKKYPNNPLRQDGTTHEYAPPEQVASEMDQMIKWHNEHLLQGVSPEVEAAWLHHRFAQIHPFQDGNGRVARGLASIIFLRAGWFPLTIDRDARKKYIEALEAADSGDLSQLTTLFANVQKDNFIKALSISDEVIRNRRTVGAVLAAAADRIEDKESAQIARYFETLNIYKKVFSLSGELEKLTFVALTDVERSIRENPVLNSKVRVRTQQSEMENEDWYHGQIVRTAKALNYFADTRTYRQWVRLQIRGSRKTDILFSFHSLGVEFLGAMSVLAFIEHTDYGENGEAVQDRPYELCQSAFTFYYNEESKSVVERFDNWLNDAILTGLDQWRRQL